MKHTMNRPDKEKQRTILSRVAALERMREPELREQWRALFGTEPPLCRPSVLVRRLSHRVQELACGAPLEEIKRRVEEKRAVMGLDDMALRRGRGGKRQAGTPVVGTRLVREWNGARCEVTVTGDGKGAFRLARELRVTLSVTGGEIVPEPEGETRELLLLLGQINACQVMRAATANSFSFSSGDKSVNKTGQPKQWADLEESLTLQYRQRVAQMTPGVHEDDGYILTPEFRPVLYEQGLDLEPLEDPHLWPY